MKIEVDDLDRLGSEVCDFIVDRTNSEAETLAVLSIAREKLTRSGVRLELEEDGIYD